MGFVKHSQEMLLWRGVSIALDVVTSIALARLLGPTDRGTLAIFVLSVSLASMIISLGTPQASIYLLGSGTIESKTVICSLFYYHALFIVLLSVPAFVVMHYATNLAPHIISLLLALTGLGILNTHLRHFLIAQKRFVQYNLSIVLDSSIFLAVVTFSWFFDSVSVSNIVVIYAVSGSLALLVSIFSWFSDDLLLKPTLRFSVIPLTLNYGFHLFIMGVGNFGIQRVPYFFLKFFSGSGVVGLFAAANTVPAMFANIPQQLATVLYSHVSNSRDETRNVQLTVMTVKFMIIVSLIFLVPVVLFAEPISLLLFGKAFAGIGKTMVILSIGMAFSGLVSVIFNLLAGSAMHKFGSYMTLINLSSISGLSLVLIPGFSIEGAAFAHMITMCLSFLFMVTVFCSVFRVRPYRLFVFSGSDINLVASRVFKSWRL